MFSQIMVGVITDKEEYRYGEIVNITVTAFNPVSEQISLNFTTSCQANCIIDNYNFINSTLCTQVLTSKTNPPNGTISWNNLKYPFSGQPSLSVGNHLIIGEVIGYGQSKPLEITVSNTGTEVETNNVPPGDFIVNNNFPNPFNNVTWIPVTLNRPGKIRICIVNSLGYNIKTIIDNDFSAGSHIVQVDLSKFSAGLYFCRFEKQGTVRTIKLLLSK